MSGYAFVIEIESLKPNTVFIFTEWQRFVKAVIMTKVLNNIGVPYNFSVITILKKSNLLNEIWNQCYKNSLFLVFVFVIFFFVFWEDFKLFISVCLI